MKTRIKNLLLLLSLLALPAVAQAQFTFTTNNGAITITGYTGPGGAVVIPNTTNGYPVTSIGVSAFYNNNSLTSVTIGTNVTSIGDSAFQGCSSLTSVTIPDSVTSIGDQAFYISGLTSVAIPASVTSIVDFAFDACSSLTNITVDASNPDYSSLGGVLFDKAQLTLIQFPGGLGPSYTIPNSVISFGDSAFWNCFMLTSVTIGNGVTSIGSGFVNCSSLMNITVDASNPDYSSLGGVLFDKAQLTLIQFPDGLGGSYTIPDSVTNIGDDAFDDTSVSSVTIPNSVTSIGDYAFVDCYSLTNVMIGIGVTSIGNDAFASDDSLTSIYFLGNSPTPTNDSSVFSDDNTGTVYYQPGTAGWGSTFDGWPTMESAGNGGGSGPNLVVNGGFETGDFTGWTTDSGSVTTGSTYAHSGTYGAQFGPVGSLGYLSQTLSTTPGTSYVLSFWLDSPDGETPNEFQVSWDGTTLLDEANIPAIGWTNIQFVVTATDTSTVLQFGFRDDPTWLGLDDISVQSVQAGPAIQFTASPTNGTPPLTVQFNSTNVDSLGNVITSWNWNFGDGATSTLQNPSHIYTVADIFTPALVATNNNGVAVTGFGPQITTLTFTSSTNFTFTTNNGEITITGYTGSGGAVTIPSTINGYPVTSIGFEAFWNRSSLTNISIPNTVTNIGDFAFFGTSLASVSIPSSVASIGQEAFIWCFSLTAITVDAQNSFYSSVNGVLFDKNQTTLLEFPGGLGGSYTIPGGVITIAPDAFQGCDSLTSVIISNGVTNIGEGAFNQCFSLSSVTIPNSVTNIGAFAFFLCSSLTAITVDVQNSFYSSVNGVLFDKSQTTVVGYPDGLSGSYTIPSGVTSIGEGAFSGCTSLISVTIPDSVNNIADYALDYCPSLTSVFFQGNAPTADSTAFERANSATVYYYAGTSGWSSTFDGIPAVMLSAPNPAGSLQVTITPAGAITAGAQWKVDGGIPQPSGATVLGLSVGNHTVSFTTVSPWMTPSNQTVSVSANSTATATGIYTEPVQYQFTYTTNADGVTLTITGYTGPGGAVAIPSTINGLPVTSIGTNAFNANKSVTDVTIPNSVTSIDDQAFYNCTSLTSVTIGTNVTSIGGDAFAYCTSLTSVTIPSSVTNFGYYTFYNCTSLTNVTIGTVTIIGVDAFSSCSSLTSVTIPDSVTNIEQGAFSGCGLTNATIGTNVAIIGDSAFAGCPLTGVTIPDSVTSIEDSAFYGCSGLTNVMFGTNVAIIGNAAFYRCTSLTSVTIPNSVTNLGHVNYQLSLGAFMNCTSLGSVIIGNGVTRIGEWSFEYCSSLTNVTMGSSVTTIALDAFNACYSLASVTGIPNSVTNIGDYAFNQCFRLTNVTFGTNLASIGQSAFYYCTNLTSLSIPGSVTSLGQDAFELCHGLTSVTIGNGVASIGVGAFEGCTSLTSVTIPDSVTIIGQYGFYSCISLTNVTIGSGVTGIGYEAFYNCTSLTSVTIANGNISIGLYAFYDCTSLTNVTIGAGVPSIGNGAFYQCTNLTGVYFHGNSPTPNNDLTVFSGDSNGIVYYLPGTTGWGTLFDGLPTMLSSLPAPAQTFTVLHTFTALNNFTNSDGANPYAGLILSGNTLYGTARDGGTNGIGIVFAVNTDGSDFTNLHNFTYSDGANPYADLILSGNTLYGTTVFYGSGSVGTVFAINTDGTCFTKLHAFAGSDGADPGAGLILSGNTLYGVTYWGGVTNIFNGKMGIGTVFAVNTNGNGFTNLYSFRAGNTNSSGVLYTNSDGANPYADLVLSGNTLYGTASDGGSSGNGTVFAINTDGTGFTVLHTFTALNNSTNSDGADPHAGLILSGNTLYGTALGGGRSGNGTVFAINTDGTDFTNLYSFSARSGSYGTNSDGALPEAGLILSGNTLYGTASDGGSSGSGTVFAINTNGTDFTSLYSFTGGSDGANPSADLILSGDILYGTASEGGTNGYGTVFSLTLGSVSVPLVVETTSLPNGTNGTSYSQTLTASGGQTPYSWTSISGALPPGLSLATNGVISGTPTSNGTFDFIVQVTDANSSTATQALTLVTSPSPNLLVNGGFESEPNWGNGIGAYDPGETELIGSQIPGWTIVTNHAVTVQIASGPYLTISGNYSVNTDGEGYDGNNSNFYQDFATQNGLSYALEFNWQSWGAYTTPTTSKLEISVVDTVTSAVLFDGLYSYDGSGPHPVHDVLANFAGTGNPLRLRIQETPQSGYNDNTFVVDNFSVTVSGTNVVPLAVTTTSLPGGASGVPYSQTLSASGGQTPYSWTNIIGVLPPGLTLATNGVISGTPTTNGTFNFTVQVTDANSSTATQALTLAVFVPAFISAQPPVETVTNGSPAFLAVGVSGSAPLFYQWQKNGINLTDGGNVSGSGTNALSLNTATTTDAGNYSVIITNACGGVTSSVVALTVIPATNQFNISLPLSTGSGNKLDLGSFAGGQVLQLSFVGHGDLVNSYLQTLPDGSLFAAAGSSYGFANPGSNYPTVAGGDGVNHYPGGGLNYDATGSGFSFTGKPTTDTTDPAGIRDGAVVGTFNPSPSNTNWFNIGYGGTFTVPAGGAHLYVAVNDSANFDNHGTYFGMLVTVAVTAPLPVLSISISSGTGVTMSGSGHFTLASSPGGVGTVQSVVAADANGDGRLDLIANGLVLTNNGSGGFGSNTTYAVGSSGSTCVVAADVNGDGKLDLITANAGSTTLTVLTNNGSGVFGSNATLDVNSTPQCVVAADVNGDGKPDLICVSSSGARFMTVFTNNGSGVFGLSSTPANGNARAFSVVAADINGDGKPDLITANFTTDTLTVFTNKGSGVFGSNATYTVGSQPRSVVAVDVNGDGKLDLISANSVSGTLTVLTNNGSGVFGSNATYTVGSQPRSVVAADVNGDGKLDLICANASGGTLTVLTNNGSGAFGLNATYTVGNSPYCVATADVNGDGLVDLISANEGSGTLTVLTNTAVLGTGPFKNVVLSWSTNAAGFGLQQNSSLATTNWLDVTNTPTVTNNLNQVTLPAAAKDNFFQLFHP